MASLIYNRFKADLPNGEQDWEANTIKVSLMDGDYPALADPDHDVWGDVSTDELPTAGGYTAGGATLATASVTQDDTNDQAKLDGDNTAWSSATFSCYGAVIWNDSHATDDLCCWFDFGGIQTVTAGTFTIQWHTDGIMTLS